MMRTLEENLDQIKDILEKCITLQPGQEELVEFYNEKAAFEGRSISDIYAKVGEVAAVIREGVALLKASVLDRGFPKNVSDFTKGFEILASSVDNYWDYFPTKLKNIFICVDNILAQEESELWGWRGYILRLWLVPASIQKKTKIFVVYQNAILRYRTAMLGALASKCHSETTEPIPITKQNEGLRAIAYSMDLLIPGLYLWFGSIAIRIGGCKPDDRPYRYPGNIHSFAGFGLVLPGYIIFTTYQRGYDPRRTSNSRTAKT